MDTLYRAKVTSVVKDGADYLFNIKVQGADEQTEFIYRTNCQINVEYLMICMARDSLLKVMLESSDSDSPRMKVGP